MLRICEPNLTAKHRRYYNTISAKLKDRLDADTARSVMDLYFHGKGVYESKKNAIGKRLKHYKANITHNSLTNTLLEATMPPEGNYRALVFQHPVWDCYSYYSLTTPISFYGYLTNLGMPEHLLKYFDSGFLDKFSIPTMYYGLYSELSQYYIGRIADSIREKCYFSDNSIICKRIPKELVSSLRHEKGMPSFGIYDITVKEFNNGLLENPFRIAIYYYLGIIQDYKIWGAPEFMHMGLYLHHILEHREEKEMYAKKEGGVLLYPELNKKPVWKIWK